MVIDDSFEFGFWFVGGVNIGFGSCDQGDFGYVKS